MHPSFDYSIYRQPLFVLLDCAPHLSNCDYAVQRYSDPSSLIYSGIDDLTPIALLTAAIFSVLVESIQASSLTRLAKRAPTCDEGVGTACTVADANNCYAGIVRLLFLFSPF